LKHSVRQHNLWSTFIAILMGIAGAAGCVALLTLQADGQPLNPILFVSAGVVAVDGWVCSLVLMAGRKTLDTKAGGTHADRSPVRLAVNGLKYVRMFVLVTAIFVCGRSLSDWVGSDGVTDTGDLLAAAVQAVLMLLLMACFSSQSKRREEQMQRQGVPAAIRRG
jgi:hypothetical protein